MSYDLSRSVINCVAVHGHLLTAAIFPPMPCHCGKPHRIKHGTKAGYEAHKRLLNLGHEDVEQCPACLDANAQYMRAYRRGTGKAVYERGVEAEMCRLRAFRRLAKLHPVKFRALFTEERRRMGLSEPYA